MAKVTVAEVMHLPSKIVTPVLSSSWKGEADRYFLTAAKIASACPSLSKRSPAVAPNLSFVDLCRFATHTGDWNCSLTELNLALRQSVLQAMAWLAAGLSAREKQLHEVLSCVAPTLWSDGNQLRPLRPPGQRSRHR